MTDHIIKAAKEAGATRAYPEAQSTRDDAYLVGQQFLERFYAIAYRAGMERAAEICDEVAASWDAHHRVAGMAAKDCAQLTREIKEAT